MMLQVAPSPLRMRLVICGTDADLRALQDAGIKSVRKVTKAEEVYRFSASERMPVLQRDFEQYDEFILALPNGSEFEALRDDLAVRLGDLKCRWVQWPRNAECAVDIDDNGALVNYVNAAKPMWTDEVCTLNDIPEAMREVTYRCGFDRLDDHGFRLVRPAFMPVIGPYGSGKSVLLRQLAVNLWRLHGWKTLITSFEERVKPRIQRDLRRHLIGQNHKPWTGEEIARADMEINDAFRFLRRKRNATLDMERFIDRVEYAVKVYGVDVVILDPVNELDHTVPKGENKTDYMGRFIMRCKELAEDYNLLFIAAAHPPKDGVEKRMSKTGILTLNDGADTAHYGNKADIGWCVWRNATGPTYLNIDKLKDHETMGEPVLAKLVLSREMNAFEVVDLGDHVLEGRGA